MYITTSLLLKVTSIGLYDPKVAFISRFFFQEKNFSEFSKKNLEGKWDHRDANTLHDVKSDIESKVERESRGICVGSSTNSDALLENFLTFINCQSQKYVLLEVRLTYN